MAPIVVTPKRSAQRRPGRPRARASEPPLKKLRYIPGGPGGGGRYVDDEGNETPVGGTGPGGYAFTGPRRSTARSAHSPNAVRSPSATLPRPRRERDRAPAQPRYSSAAAAATAMTQNEGYKPREERSWEEFHNDLDIEVDFVIYSAEEVDRAQRESNPVTPYRGLALQNTRSLSENGAVSLVDEALLAQQTPPGQPDFSHDHDMITVGGPPISPAKRRPGRPPKQSMLSGLGSPPAPRIIPLPTHNPKERLNLPKPNYRKVETFLAYEQSKDVGVNFVDKSLANVGYQESDRFFRPVETYIRGGEGSIEEELDFASMRNEDEGASNSAFIGRVEYDMDEQDERWLEGINGERLAEQHEAIRPAIFEITMTQIEKEWHALEKRKFIVVLYPHECALTRLSRYPQTKPKATSNPSPKIWFRCGGEWRSTGGRRRARLKMCNLRRWRLRKHKCDCFLRRLRFGGPPGVLRRTFYT
jgi:NuA3 HAT complex component NTO1